MANWTANKCGFCAYTSGSPLTKYTCQGCSRMGCPECMPLGEQALCNSCIGGYRDPREPLPAGAVDPADIVLPNSAPPSRFGRRS